MKFKAFFKYGVVIAWLAMGFSIFRTEAGLVVEMPKTMALTPQERKVKVDGPVFTLIDNVRGLTPEDSSVAFLFEKFIHFRKAAYYLYPRKISQVADLHSVGEAAAIKDDYLAVYIPGTAFEEETYRAIASNAALVKIYEKDGGAIFKVSKGRGQ